MTDREAMQQALEVLNVYASKAEHKRTHADNCAAEEIITALRSRLEQPEQEPVAWMMSSQYTDETHVTTRPSDWGRSEWSSQPLYTTPPAAQPAAWVGLTDEDIARAGNLKRMLPYAYARAIEKLLRSKNGGAA